MLISTKNKKKSGDQYCWSVLKIRKKMNKIADQHWKLEKKSWTILLISTENYKKRNNIADQYWKLEKKERNNIADQYWRLEKRGIILLISTEN